MNYIDRLLFMLAASVVLFATGCATTIETTMEKQWEQNRVFDSDADKMHAQMMLTDEGDAVTLVSPGGVQTVDESGEVTLERDRDSFFSFYVETSRGEERLTDKVTYLYLPHRHAILEFNYATFAESVSMINLNDKSIDWVANDLKWSLERYQTFARALSKGLSLGGQIATETASDMLLPERFVGNLTKVVPELDVLLFKTIDGLVMVSLEDGSIIWKNTDFEGGIAEIIYDSQSDSFIAVNSDDEAFSLEGLQFNKQMMRIDRETGETEWESNYDGNIREKLDGFGIWADRRTDIRLVDGKIMLNFLNVEVYDFETGDQLWQTTTGNDRLLDFVAPEAQIMNLFAFPVIQENILYRVNHENAGLTGVDVVVQAFDYQTGELLWKTDKLSRSSAVNDMLISGDHLVVSMDGEEKVVGLNRSTGEVDWETGGFGKQGTQYEMREHSGNIMAAGFGKISMLDASTGEEVYSINISEDGLGSLTDITLHNNRLYTVGENGFGVYNPGNGSLTKSVNLPSGGILYLNDDNDRVLIAPKPAYSDAQYPADGAFHLVESASGNLLGTLGTDGGRKDWKISPDYSKIYVLRNDKVEMYSTN